MKDLAGKTAFVTGAASGIGLGIATAFAQAGVKVMLCDIEAGALAKAVEGLKATNADVEGVRADVSLKAELKAAADATIARYGKVHILVNNAGVGGGGPYGAWTDAAWDWTLGVNLMAVVWGIEIFGPLLDEHGEGGHIVSTASIAGLISRQQHALQRHQIWRRGAVGRLALRAGAARDRRLGAVPRLHPHPHHRLAAQPAAAIWSGDRRRFAAWPVPGADQDNQRAHR